MEMLTVGRFVKIHSLVSEKARQHNGKTAIVKTSISNCRCGVELAGDSSGGTKKILAIKPANLTILCSFCKMREAKTEPKPVLCKRCQKESYCSATCRNKHWEGANKETGVPNCHEAWCIPIQLEMKVPTKPIGESNIGEQAYEEVSRYLQLAADIGNSGRKSEEKVMLEKLLEVDPMQPSAYNNLFVGCSQLAVMAERYHPEKYEELSFKAILYLKEGIQLIVLPDGGVGGLKKALDGPHTQIEEAFVRIINDNALGFIEACMRGERGAGNTKLENIESCLMACLVLFDRRDEPMYKLHTMLGFCSQKLAQYEDAVSEFLQCCHAKPDDAHWYHSLTQIPQCLSCIALYHEDKSPAERMETMEKAVSKFEEAIAILKKDKKKENCLPVYSSQYQLARILYNKNSLQNQLAQRGEIDYPEQQKKDLISRMNVTASVALRGAVAARDMAEVQAIQGLQNLECN